MSDILGYILLGQFVLLLHLWVVIYLKLRIYRVTVAYLRSAADTLDIVKVWCELAHIQHKDAKRVMAKVEAKTDGTTTPTDVLQAVAAVPEKTAEKVVERIAGASESGTRLPRLNPEG